MPPLLHRLYFDNYILRTGAEMLWVLENII
nr:MAG TPA: hypothetical protein [Caudoviricetes sp.]